MMPHEGEVYWKRMIIRRLIDTMREEVNALCDAEYQGVTKYNYERVTWFLKQASITLVGMNELNRSTEPKVIEGDK